ncbi:MAG: YfiR family protein [Chryseolinea sp.]
MKLSLFIFWLVLSLTLFAARQEPQPETSKEYQIKAVFLFNFTHFVEWPAASFHEPTAPFVIGIMGRDPFGSYLDETVRGENLQGHPLVIRRFKSLDDVDACHILFINIADKEEIKHVLDKVKGKPVLTVGDVNNFARQGGMIRFITESNRTRIRINLEAAKQADLTISSKLLKLAEIVETQSK